jgi:hypothetical protein
LILSLCQPEQYLSFVFAAPGCDAPMDRASLFRERGDESLYVPMVSSDKNKVSKYTVYQLIKTATFRYFCINSECKTTDSPLSIPSLLAITLHLTINKK